MKDTQVKIVARYRQKLDEIVQARKKNHDPIRTKQGVVEQLIDAAHRKECKKY